MNLDIRTQETQFQKFKIIPNYLGTYKLTEYNFFLIPLKIFNFQGTQEPTI